MMWAHSWIIFGMFLACGVVLSILRLEWSWEAIGVMAFGGAAAGFLLAIVTCVFIGLKVSVCELYTPPTEQVLSTEAMQGAIAYNKALDQCYRAADDPVYSFIFRGTTERIRKLEKIDLPAYGYYIPTVQEWEDVAGESGSDGSAGEIGLEGSEFTNSESKEALVPG